jgi:acyl-CoA thioesterase I
MKTKTFLKLGVLSFAALSLGVVGCGKKPLPEARLTPLADDAVILIYASGIAEDGDIFRSTVIDETLSTVLKRTVINGSVGAEFSESALKRLPAVLTENKPNLMILGYGAMDLWKKTDRVKLKANLCAMIDLARTNQTQVVMLAMPDLNRLSPKPDPLFEEVAREKNVPIDTAIIRAVLSDGSTRTFRYLPNDDGIQKMAEAIRDLCIQRGALPK